MIRSLGLFKLPQFVHGGSFRSFSKLSPLLNAADGRLRRQQKDQQKENKRKLKKEQLVKNKNKQSPELHPLYMDVPQAMKYIRAAEVGNPAERTTVSILMTVIPERGSKPLSGSVFFPNPIKESSIMVFTLDENLQAQARARGASRVGGLELIEEIRNGSVKLENFTQSFATPDILKDIAQIAKYLGPRNLMPSTKRGTVSPDIVKLIESNYGALPFRQRDQHLSIPVGKCSFSDKEILENLKAASDAIYGSQPPGTKKPNLLGKTCLSSTMGPSLVINFRP